MYFATICAANVVTVAFLMVRELVLVCLISVTKATVSAAGGSGQHLSHVYRFYRTNTACFRPAGPQAGERYLQQHVRDKELGTYMADVC